MAEGVSIKQAAGILGCSVDTVRRHIAAGRLAAYRIGCGTKRSHLKVSVDEIERFRRAQRVAAEQPQTQTRSRPRTKRRKWLA